MVQDNFREMTKLFKRRIKFDMQEGYAVKNKIGAGFARINPLTLQQLAHGIIDFVLNYQPRPCSDLELFLKQEKCTQKAPMDINNPNSPSSQI